MDAVYLASIFIFFGLVIALVMGCAALERKK